MNRFKQNYISRLEIELESLGLVTEPKMKTRSIQEENYKKGRMKVYKRKLELQELINNLKGCKVDGSTI
jgi:hypothetical protein